MRRVRIVIALFALLSIYIVHIAVAERPAHAAVIFGTCTPNTTYTGTSVNIECVQGFNLRTRGRLDAGPSCLLGRPAGHVYRPGECGFSGRIEYIGQARAIAYLSSLKGMSGTGVHQNLQWETEMDAAGHRADIIQTDGASMQIIEAKVSTNPDYSSAPAQLQGYVTSAISIGYANVSKGTFLAGYFDEFETYAGRCQDGSAKKRQWHVTMDSTPGYDGILRIEDKGSNCPEDQDDEEEEENEEEEGEDEEWWDDIPPIPIAPSPPDEHQPTSDDTDDDCNYFCEVKRGFEITAEELAKALAYGDPHLVTLDGLHYDLQSAGEFDFAVSEQYGLHVQARFGKTSGGSWSAVDRIAMRVNGYQLELRKDGTLLLDGHQLNLPVDHRYDLGGNSTVLRTASKYFVLWPGNDKRPILSFKPAGNASAIGMYYPTEKPADIKGLVGNADGLPANDLKLRDGTQLDAKTPAATLHGSYADSWRITDATSLFTYGAGENTATHTDRAYPTRIVTINSLTADERALGERFCAENGIPAGPQFDDCVLDMALTQNTELALMAGERKTVAVDPNGAVMNAAGDIVQDYEADPLPTNFNPAVLTQDPVATTFAGPFAGRSAYRFYVQNVPAHTGGKLTFELLAIGDWAADSTPESVTVALDRADIWTSPAQMSAVRSGTLGNGQPFKVYAVNLPLTHDDSQIEVAFTAAGVDGLANEAFGVDNVTVHVDPVAPQSFDVQLPFGVSDGVPGAGAGRLETPVSQDEYKFTVGAAGEVYVDMAGCDREWRIVNAAGASMGSGVCGGGKAKLPTAGTYRLLVKGEVGTYGASVFVVPAPDVFNVSVPFTGAGSLETKASTDEFRFAAAAGADIFVKVTTCPEYLTWRLYSATETVEVGHCGSGEAVRNLEAGDYRLVVSPSVEKTGDYALTVNPIAADVIGTTTVDGPATTVTTTTPGQRARVTFPGSNGQRILVKVSGLTAAAWTYLRAPDGKELGYSYCSKACVIDLKTLAADGTYTLLVEHNASASGPVTLSVVTVPADLNLTGQIGGSPIAVTNVAGQNAELTFDGVGGNPLTIMIDNSLDAWITLYGPDGAKLKHTYTVSSPFILPRQDLPSTGAYRLIIDPQDGAAGTQTVKLLDIPGDVTATATVGGDPITVTTTVSGQYAVVSFAGTSGQKVSMKYPGTTVSSTEMTLKSPNGDILRDTAIHSSSFTEPVTLPGTGTYKVYLQPKYGAVGTIGLQMFDVPADVTATAVVNGPGVIVTTAVPGQRGVVTFNGTAGQRVSVTFPGTAAYSYLRLSKPDGTLLKETGFHDESIVEPMTLPATGVYTVNLSHDNGRAGAIGVRLHLVPDDVVVDASIGGAKVDVTTTVPGQNGNVLFYGAAGQRVSVTMPSSTDFSALVSVRKPDGGVLVGERLASRYSAFVETFTLPVSGPYTLSVDGYDEFVGTVPVQLHLVPGDATANGTDVSLTLTTPGQNGKVTFPGVAGKRVSVTFPRVDMWTYVTVRNPDGAVLSERQSATSDTAFVEPVTLPVTGDYTIEVDGYQEAIGTIALKVHDVPVDPAYTATVSGAATNVTTTVPGQNATIAFTATAGQRIAMSASANTLGSADVELRAPDGTKLYDGYFTSSWVLEPMVLQAAGDYILHIDPSRATVGAVTLAINEVNGDVSASLPLDGMGVTLTTTVPSQNIALGFTGSAGQRVSLKISNTSLGFSDVRLTGPSGQLVLDSYAGSSGAFFNPVTLPTDGAYTLVIDPDGTKTGTATIQGWNVPADVTATATLDGTLLSVPTTVPGQAGVVSFAGTAGRKTSFKVGNDVPLDLVVRKPDGSVLEDTYLSAGGGFVDPLALPATGNYTVTLHPSDGKVGNLTLHAYDVPAPVAANVALDGTQVSLTTTVPGQQAVYSFAGTAGNKLSAFIGAGKYSSIVFRNPDGSTLKSTGTSSSLFVDTMVLPATGVYTVTYTPNNGDVTTVTLKAYDVPADLTRTATLDGAQVTLALPVPGQRAMVSFAGTAGKNVSMKFTGTTASSSLVLKRPNGTVLKSQSFSASSYLAPLALPETGIYTIELKMSSGATGTIALRVYDVPADATVSTTIGGAAVPMTITAPGQKGVVSFTATAGKIVNVLITGNTCGYTTFTVRKPDGTTVVAKSSSAASYTISAVTLPIDATYTILIEPSSGGIGTMNVQVT